MGGLRDGLTASEYILKLQKEVVMTDAKRTQPGFSEKRRTLDDALYHAKQVRHAEDVLREYADVKELEDMVMQRKLEHDANVKRYLGEAYAAGMFTPIMGSDSDSEADPQAQSEVLMKKVNDFIPVVLIKDTGDTSFDSILIANAQPGAYELAPGPLPVIASESDKQTVEAAVQTGATPTITPIITPIITPSSQILSGGIFDGVEVMGGSSIQSSWEAGRHAVQPTIVLSSEQSETGLEV